VKKLLSDKGMKKDILKNKSKELCILFKEKSFSLRDIVFTLLESVLFNPERVQNHKLREIKQKKKLGVDQEG
jgi:hypothetical protein